MKTAIQTVVLILFIITTGAELMAQSLPAMQSRDRSFGVEWIKPGLRGKSNAGGLASSVYLSYSHPLPAFNIVAEVPLAFVGDTPNLNRNNITENPEGIFYIGRDFAFEDSAGSSATLGNIYLGVNTRKEKNDTYVETGLRIPFATEFEDGKGQATAIGIYSDFVERLEAFSPEYLTAVLMVHKHKSEEKKFSYHVEGGLNVLFPIRDVTINPELFFRYGFLVVQETNDLGVEAGVKGRIMMSRNPDFFQDQTVHQFSARAYFRRGALSPGIYFSRPFDNNLNNVLNWMLGLSLAVQV